jgi:predicted ATP-grasp superfamily ATP-dependent carboligase
MPESHPVELFEEAPLREALVLLAFPTTGSASSIAAQYMVRHLDLPLVGHVRLPELQGLVSIQDGRVTSPVRIFGGEVACRIGRECPRVFIVTTEIALPPAVLARIGEAVMAWAAAGDAQMILVLEGVVRMEGDDTPDVYCASADPALLADLQKNRIEPMERAIIAGISAQVLLESPRRGVLAGALLVEASREHPDGRAAAALIEAVSRMIPDVPVNAQPLLEEAMQLEREIKGARDIALAQVPTPQTSFI